MSLDTITFDPPLAISDDTEAPKTNGSSLLVPMNPVNPSAISRLTREPYIYPCFPWRADTVNIQTISSIRPYTFSLASASVGALVWSIAVALLQPGWAAALFLFAPLVLTPLGLALVTVVDRSIGDSRTWQAIIGAQLPAALLLLPAFALPPGPTTALALPWFLLTGLVAWVGIVRSWSWRERTVDEQCRYAGMVYLAVGGGWLVVSRAGYQPLGFSDIIVLATAVHFHYAGFVLPLLVGMAARAVPGRMASASAAGVIVGVPLTAVGITLSAFEIRWPEWLASWFLVAACAMTAALHLRAARRKTGCTRAFLAVSAFSLLAGMTLAALYALGGYWGTWRLEIPDMLPWHGAVNAFGFALTGLLGWNLAEVGNPETQRRGDAEIGQIVLVPTSLHRRFWIMRNGT